MAYTCTLILELPSAVASAVQAYLTSQAPTTIHCISATKQGQLIAVLICTE